MTATAPAGKASAAPGGETRGVRLYPTDRDLADRHIVRRARLVIGREEIVYIGPRGSVERRVPAGGPNGVVRAAHVSIPSVSPAEYGTRRRAVEAGAGCLDFLDASDRVLLNVPLAAWFPGFAEYAARVRPKALHEMALRTTGFAAALGSAGIGIRPVIEFSDPLFGNFRRFSSSDSLGLANPWPRRVGVISYLMCTLVLALVALSGPVPALIYAAGATLLAASVLPLAYVYGWMRWRDSRSQVAPSLQLRPVPAGVHTRRFRKEAAVRVVGDDIVFSDGLGCERWLPMRWTHGVAGCLLLRDTGTGEPVAVRFRSGDGTQRATLPWRDWFGDERGEERLADFAASCGLELTESRTRVVRDPNTGLPAIDGAATYRCLDRSEVESKLKWRRDLTGPWQHILVYVIAPLLALILLIPSPRTSGEIVAGVLAVLALLFATAPEWVARAWRRLWWDRPLRPRADGTAAGRDADGR